MDTSETYIKMCEKAEEIQELLSSNGGYLHTREERSKTREPYPYVAIYDGGPTCPKCKLYRDSPFCPECGTKVEKFLEGPYVSFGGTSESNIKNDRCIYLPRQDQLQEMVREHRPFAIRLIYRFRDWMDSLVIKDEVCSSGNYFNNPNLNYESMEQLWLAFVMKEKYNKIWDGDAWIFRK